jgi:Mce-associated membrane protein
VRELIRRRGPALLTVLAVIAAGWLFWDGSTRRAAQQAGDHAVRAARDAIPAIMSYRPDTAEKDLPAAARERLTGKFLADYTQLMTTVVIPEARQKAISATGTVPAAAVVTADTHHAVVLAYVDQTVTVGAEAPTQMNSTVRLRMDNVDGRWLISGFDPI